MLDLIGCVRKQYGQRLHGHLQLFEYGQLAHEYDSQKVQRVLIQTHRLVRSQLTLEISQFLPRAKCFLRCHLPIKELQHRWALPTLTVGQSKSIRMIGRLKAR